MIFESNTTMLGTLDIPMAEGYDCSTGIARALIESAKNDMAMFRAMLEVDQREAIINRQTNGFVNESEIMALREAAGTGIWQKIKDLFTALIAKLKSIWNNFIAKLTGLMAKDATLVKKYKQQVLSKGAKLDRMQCKYSRFRSGFTLEFDILEPEQFSLNDFAGLYDKEESKMLNNIYKRLYEGITSAENSKEFEDEIRELVLEDEETGDFKDYGISMVTIINFLETYDKNINKLKSSIKKSENNLGKIVREAERKVSTVTKGTKDDNGKTQVDATAIDDATKTYQVALKYQEAYLVMNRASINIITYVHKTVKAIFMKAVTINEKKLEESSIYADAIAEAAATEVETVIKGAIASEEFSKFNNASTYVKDGDVTDDYNALTYGPDCYTPSKSCVPTSGTVDSDINGKIGGKSEAAYFGSPLF